MMSATIVRIMVSIRRVVCILVVVIIMIQGVPYDCSSIMHYGTETFSVGGEEKPTMIRRHDDCDLRLVVT